MTLVAPAYVSHHHTMDEKAPELHQLESQTDRPEEDLPAYDDAETRRILRKADWRVIPCLAAMYLVSFIDRSNSESVLMGAQDAALIA